MNITRRDLLAGLAGLSAAHLLHAAELGKAQPIIDSHIHVWEQKILNPAWLAKAPEILRRRYMADEYLRATAGLDVVRAVYVEIAESNERRPAEARFIVDHIQNGNTPIAAAIIGGDPAADGFADYVKQYRKTAEVKGVRCFFRKDCQVDPRFVAGICLLGELKMSFDLVLGWDLLEGAQKLVKDCPDTRFILDHCAYGNPDWFDPENVRDAAIKERRGIWERGVAELARCENVVCKISCVAEMSKTPSNTKRLAPVVEYCLDQFGEDRVLFGSNWPVCLKAITIAKWVESVREIVAPRGAAFARKLFHDNAIRWYRLKP